MVVGKKFNKANSKYIEARFEDYKEVTWWAFTGLIIVIATLAYKNGKLQSELEDVQIKLDDVHYIEKSKHAKRND